MLSLRRSLLLAAFAVCGVTVADDTKKTDDKKETKAIPAIKVIPAVKVIPAEKKDDAKKDEKKADAKKADPKAEAKKKAEEEAKRMQEEADKYQREYEAQLKKTQEEGEKAASHKLLKEIKLTGKGGNSLQTIGVDATGRVLALVAQPRGFSGNQKNVTSEIHVLDENGKSTGVWTVKFHANAVNAGPDGTVYVAGDGKIAKFDKDGKMVGEVAELPFIADMLKDKDKLKEKAEKQIKQQKDSFANMVKQYKDRVAKLEEKEKAAKDKGEELSKSDATQLKQNRQIIDSFKDTEKYYDSMTVQSVLDGMLGRVKVVNSVSANEKELFLVCGESEGYGFGLWRMDLDLKNPKKIMANISGCCGQMDVQCCGDDIVVAENTKHRFAKYDRDGKELAAGGKRGGDTEPGCFGGCCNPMNVKGCGGDILTAESEGLIKKFGPTGEFKGIVGAVKISGGCKNVAVGSNPDASRVYFCDQPGSRVLILAKKDEKKGEEKKGGN
jgi:hypothetical protein